MLLEKPINDNEGLGYRSLLPLYRVKDLTFDQIIMPTKNSKEQSYSF